MNSNVLNEEEMINSIDTLQKQCTDCDISFFVELAKKYYTGEFITKCQPDVIVLGSNIPEELIYAMNLKIFWILGGSINTLEFASSLVPRDTDDVSQSMLGYFEVDWLKKYKNKTVIVPLISDSSRKITQILNKTNNVITIDYPADKGDVKNKNKLMIEFMKLKDELCKINKTRMSKKRLINSFMLVNEIRKEKERFIHICKYKTDVISGPVVLFILNTYYYTDNIEEWKNELIKLTNFIKKKEEKVLVTEIRPKLLFMGSPVIFPNYKIPFLLYETKMDVIFNISTIIHKSSDDFKSEKRIFSIYELLEYIVWQFYISDCSAGFFNNQYSMDQFKNLLINNDLDGIVYCVLKGQIAYDYELPSYEEVCYEHDIPIFRLETSYNYHDIEQIRIRMEAFKEMLEHKIIKELKNE